MDDCVFCNIVAGTIPATKVYEDDRVLAFEDINPMAPVHVVLVPKRHLATVMDMADDDRELPVAIFAAVRKIARNAGMDDAGFRVVVNCNPDGGQVIFHLHVHILGGKKLSDGLG